MNYNCLQSYDHIMYKALPLRTGNWRRNVTSRHQLIEFQLVATLTDYHRHRTTMTGCRW